MRILFLFFILYSSNYFRAIKVYATEAWKNACKSYFEFKVNSVSCCDAI